MTNTDDRLKPCPFCGGEADLSDALAGTNGLSLRARNPRCKRCGADHGYYPDAEDAIAGWNRRASITLIDGDSVVVPWVSVDEKLPDRGEHVWCRNRDGRHFEGCVCYGMHKPFFTIPHGDGNPSNTAPSWIDVTHWRALPEPPLEAAENDKGGSVMGKPPRQFTDKDDRFALNAYDNFQYTGPRGIYVDVEGTKPALIEINGRLHFKTEQEEWSTHTYRPLFMMPNDVLRFIGDGSATVTLLHDIVEVPFISECPKCGAPINPAEESER